MTKKTAPGARVVVVRYREALRRERGGDFLKAGLFLGVLVSHKKVWIRELRRVLGFI